ncbi:hypothetical protein CROQUDRAFT_94312 [Cronartium quercuum f. sp. fusiforme G11]|uniref:Uncharacterized protein n=1 Tax=Cronartium quercuum f. sp. fusiforme G11 TaxID=708437 RepID=A0A9P6TAD2_9BASI|nr:hypothetical protein CROQUDRAFT_94312 [Cronartium quercuum f. sp. fusiforme G11]
MIRTLISILVVLLTAEGVMWVGGIPSVNNRRAVSSTSSSSGSHMTGIDPQVDLMSTMGPVTPTGCSKFMEWKAGKPSYDKDQLAERLALYNNVWGASSTSSDSMQSVKCDKYEEGTVSWTTTLSFKSGNPSLDNQVKSYSNVAWYGKPVQISALNKFTTSWNWKLTEESTDLVADVSYDIFTSKSSSCSGQGGGCASHEIMIWLVSKGGATPAGSKVPKKTVTIGKNHEFEVWKGVVGGIQVISLVPVQGKAYQRFKGNFIPLLLTEDRGEVIVDLTNVVTGSSLKLAGHAQTISEEPVTTFVKNLQ